MDDAKKIVLSLTGVDCNKIAIESFKKDLVDYCNDDRKKWLTHTLNDIYEHLYLPTRKERYDSLSENVKNEYLVNKKAFGIQMDVIKRNAIIRIAIETLKFYGSKEKFIEVNGQFLFDRFFSKESGSKIDTRVETLEEMIKNGFS